MKIDVHNMTFEDIASIEPDFSENFSQFWSIEILKSDFKSQDTKYIVAKLDDEIIGLAGIKIILDEANIMNIVTRVDMRNLGIGSLLLQALIQLSQSYNCQTITLEVNEHNSCAIHLYEKYAFERIGFRKKYYNNTDDAILMTKKLKEETNEKEK